MSDWLSDYLDWKADHPELDQASEIEADLAEALAAVRAATSRPATEQ
ncbi:hypothetical protein [Streptomyces sp. NBC_01022]|nr:hypothetical protein [Streptomyces sp. NBC_01022]WRZ84869.1 hypothetical protein OG316_33705 [Streptomyces sp. NBC_01022]